MSRERVYEQSGLAMEQTNLEYWPTVDESTLDESERFIYINRKKAVTMYFQRVSLEEIKQETGIVRQNVRRFTKRCMQYDQTGIVWGFRALIPQKNVKEYQLDLFTKKQNNLRRTGEFNRFLDKYPDIRELLEDLFRGRKGRSIEPVMKVKYIHKRFVDECRKKGITQAEYPLNTEWMGYKAVQRYVKRISYEYFSRSAERHGDDALQKARHVGEGQQNQLSNLFPFQKVQFDAHRIDGYFVVEIPTPDGDIMTEVLERFWVLTIIDVATRNILGYHISLNHEYSASDFMQCARNAVMPHKRLELTIPGLSYHPEGGFPSEKFPEIAWAVWDVICLDNAKAHYARMVKNRLENLIGCFMNFGPVALPMRRGIIERFFQTLEENGFHRLPNTTGSGPKDPRRKNPEQQAIQLNITYDHLKQLIDVLISNYNGTPHGGIYHQTPLELLEKRMNTSGLMPRILEEDKRSEILFMQTIQKRTIRGSLKSGKKPYIEYEGVPYRSDRLANLAYLINTEITLHVNVDDLRTLKAFLPDGSELGYLTASGRWSLTPHSLQTRKAINSLVRKKLIHLTTWDDPIFVYTNYIMNQKKSKKMVNKQIKIMEESTYKPDNAPSEQKKALEEASFQHERLDKVRQEQMYKEQLSEMEDYDRLAKQFKTKMY
ncbi:MULTISPECIES: hypothetical protein [Paenibacillus]|uniref:Integrase catalytic domain-containing protein n=2 Tax=Paenibacillus TaxID=44249 RepID=A0A7Y6BVD6_9BACL|nr:MULTISPECIES: hypothetical protein [Paenibacillus]KGP81919.1 hypothetical protein P364_0113915 [Paenibacillus sp. MAEPY2]KGP87351.1 hypothetical protein P363_0112415 [Paenibacillus sp. MAEPY1]MDN4603832.1 hypothetical protein [Paenibacillus vandeheii]NUU75705.1 hypothetical protein [Paenibacillus xylanilyticus]